MTIDSFFSTYLGKYIDFDGYFGFQCVDLMRKFVKDVYGLNPYTAIPSTGSAKNIYYNFKNNQYFKKITNTPSGIPQKGDILFFKNSTWFPFLFGKDGHVGVVASADLYNIVLFNQNYPTGTACHYTTFKYKDCLGWLRRI